MRPNLPDNPRRGGILGGLLLIFLAAVVCVVVGGLYIARNVRVNTIHRPGGSDDVTVETPAGSLSVRAHEHPSLASFGVPNYPGARQTNDSGGATFSWTSDDGRNDRGLSVAGVELVTDDSPEKVVEYYKQQLPHWLIATERDGSTRLELQEGGYKRMIAIHGKRDGTHIGVATIGKPASN